MHYKSIIFVQNESSSILFNLISIVINFFIYSINLALKQQMGNQSSLTKGCMHSSNLCNEQYSPQTQQHPDILLKKRVKSPQQIKQKVIAYVQQNKIQYYTVRERKVLQTLVSVDQEHIGNKVLELDKIIKMKQLQVKQLTWQRQRQARKNNAGESHTKTYIHDNKTNAQKQQENQIARLKQLRKELFLEAQRLLLQDLDMIFEQIPNFDQNYEVINNIVTMSQNKIDVDGKQNLLKVTTLSNNFIAATSLSETNLSALSNIKNSLNKSSCNRPQQNAKTSKKDSQKLKAILNLEDKKSLRLCHSNIALGKQILRNNQLLILAPIQCFSGKGALKDNRNTGLPSGATLFQILMNKIKSVNLRRNCFIGLVFLVNQSYVNEFNQEISKIQGIQNQTQLEKLQIDSNLSNQGSEDFSHKFLRYRVVPFKNSWPCFNQQEKISITKQKYQISFCHQDGDVIGFIQNSIQLKSLIQKYRFVNITNVNNMLSQIGDIAVLGCLDSKSQIDICVKVLKPKSQQFQLSQFFHTDDKGFIEIKLARDSGAEQQYKNFDLYQSNPDFINTEDYYIKSRIFTTQFGPLKRLLMSRIKRQITLNPSENCLQFYLKRHISDILYHKFTLFVEVEEDYEFTHVKSSNSQFKPNLIKNGQIGYSRYCKRILGLKNCQPSKQREQLVQIDSGILHKGSDEIYKLIKKIETLKEIGFPIILYSDFFNTNQNQ